MGTEETEQHRPGSLIPASVYPESSCGLSELGSPELQPNKSQGGAGASSCATSCSTSCSTSALL